MNEDASHQTPADLKTAEGAFNSLVSALRAKVMARDPQRPPVDVGAVIAHPLTLPASTLPSATAEDLIGQPPTFAGIRVDYDTACPVDAFFIVEQDAMIYYRSGLRWTSPMHAADAAARTLAYVRQTPGLRFKPYAERKTL